MSKKKSKKKYSGKNCANECQLQKPQRLNLQLCGKLGISNAFGTSTVTVSKWIKEGAPIYIVGNRYQADYLHLLKWLEQNQKKFRRCEHVESYGPVMAGFPIIHEDVTFEEDCSSDK